MHNFRVPNRSTAWVFFVGFLVGFCFLFIGVFLGVCGELVFGFFCGFDQLVLYGFLFVGVFCYSSIETKLLSLWKD